MARPDLQTVTLWPTNVSIETFPGTLQMQRGGVTL